MPTPRFVRPARRVGLLFALLWAAGCGTGPTTPGGASGGTRVSGSVKLNDQPVNYGVVAFHIGDRVVKSPIYPDGTYSLNNPPPGEAKVVLLVDPTPPPMAAAAGGPQAEKPPKLIPVKVPAKYADKATTDLTYTVGAGPQTYDIRMTSE
jgi:hypothetical protein